MADELPYFFASYLRFTFLPVRLPSTISSPSSVVCHNYCNVGAKDEGDGGEPVESGEALTEPFVVPGEAAEAPQPGKGQEK
jgi:hypothetical protein